ncbi:MAG: HEAT repeat domain-containing protein [Myxococcales bacterium]|nr:HEAT repeat domain-containing protein [Myxococcales bacterium]
MILSLQSNRNSTPASPIIAEIWLSVFPRIPPILQHPHWNERFPFLQALCGTLSQATQEAAREALASSTTTTSPTSPKASTQKTKSPKQPAPQEGWSFWRWLVGGPKDEAPAIKKLERRNFPSLRPSMLWETSVSVEVQPLLEELEAFVAAFTKEEAPPRYLFAPMVKAGTPLPTFSRKRLKTGMIEAAYDRCLINRNWDGIDRFEDLTARNELEDLTGMYRIFSLSLRAYLEPTIQAWIGFLRRHLHEKTVDIVIFRYAGDAETLAVQVLERAERWRALFQLPDYLPERLEKAESRFLTLFAKIDAAASPPEEMLRELMDLGAYLGEVIRASLGGCYAQLEPSSEPLGEPAVGLLLPFRAESYPIEKVMRALHQRRKISLRLQADVQMAHRRQSALLERLGAALDHDELARRRASLRIMADIADTRVDHAFVERLFVEKDDELLMRLLERLQHTPFQVEPTALYPLVKHPHDGVAARAIAILGGSQDPALPEILQLMLAGGERIPLRPIARKVLEGYTNPHAKRVLKSLGPIPSMTTGTPLFSKLPPPRVGCPLLAEILENSNNPSQQDAALQILCAFPDEEEEEALRRAISDPQRSLRMAAVALLAESDRPFSRTLLKGRRMFEEDALVRLALLEAIAAFPEEGTRVVIPPHLR